MPRYVVTMRHGQRDEGGAPTALEALSAEPDVTVLNPQPANPNVIVIEASAERVAQLNEKLSGSYIIEPEIRRQLK